jgi:hypothetical protein
MLDPDALNQRTIADLFIEERRNEQIRLAGVTA